MRIRNLAIVALLAAAAAGAWAQSTELTGAGATFPLPLYTKMFDVYAKEMGVKVNYQGIGSGGGIQQLTAQTVDFGGSDAFMDDAQLAKVPGAVVHIPVVAGAVVMIYNLPGNPELVFTPQIISDIFLGNITQWNDAKIAAANPRVTLPDLAIAVVRRSDGSGTTFTFTDYLSKVSSTWKDKVGRGTSVNWPTGVGAKGNPGVAGLAKQLPGSFGYVELIYALQNKLSFASVVNRNGAIVRPSLASTAAAANTALPDDMRVMITDTEVADGYPIAGFTWILLYKEQSYGNRSLEKAQAVAKMAWWMTHEGQKYAEELNYAKLSPAAVARAEVLLRSLTYKGTALLK
jgi:phosphate transport system substrate-binding protein